MCTASIGDQLTILSTSEKPTEKPKPAKAKVTSKKAQPKKVATQTSTTPEPKVSHLKLVESTVETAPQPAIIATPEAAPAAIPALELVEQTFNVLFDVPAGTRVKGGNGSPLYLMIPIGHGLKIAGDPDVLGAVDVLKGGRLQAVLTLKRLAAYPYTVQSVSCEARSATYANPVRLQMLNDNRRNFKFRPGEQGYMLRRCGFILKLTKMDLPQESAAIAA